MLSSNEQGDQGGNQGKHRVGRDDDGGAQPLGDERQKLGETALPVHRVEKFQQLFRQKTDKVGVFEQIFQQGDDHLENSVDNELKGRNELGDDQGNDGGSNSKQCHKGQQQADGPAALPDEKAGRGLFAVVPFVKHHQDVDKIGQNTAPYEGLCRPQGLEGKGGKGSPVVNGQVEQKKGDSQPQQQFGCPYGVLFFQCCYLKNQL